MKAPPLRVRIIHETNPAKYFPAVFSLAESGKIVLTGTHRYSVCKEWLRSGLRDRTSLRPRTTAAFSDILMRARIPIIANETIIVGFAPWDWRILIYRHLARRNRVIYHTSWPCWDDSVPRQYGPATALMRQAWIRFLSRANVRIVTVAQRSADDLRERFGFEPTTIPHAVPEAFFIAKRASEEKTHDQPAGGPSLRLIYVGELSEKKGLRSLMAIMDAISIDATLVLVGDGPLRRWCERESSLRANVRMLGPIWDREDLARTMAAQDVLVLPSQRVGGWEELFGIVLIEAAAAGLGVVATDHIGPETVLRGHDLGNLFADGDWQGISEFLNSLGADPARLARFKRAHQSIAQPYSLEAVAEAWQDVLDSEL